MPNCSIIIPHLNQSDHLERCLSALVKQSVPSGDFEVLVIDNGSSDDVSALVNSYGFQYHQWRDNHNPYECRNLGIQYAKSDVIAFLDAKCIPDENWLMEGLKKIKHADVVGGHYDILTQDRSISQKIFPLMYLNNAKNIEKGLGISAGNLFVRAKVFQTIGMFETDHYSGNDILFTEKASAQGFTLKYASNSIVTYPPKSFEELKADVYKYGKGAFLTRQKTVVDSLKFYLPMRIENFKNAVELRNFDLSIWEGLRAWMLVWRIKIQFALGILNSALFR